MWFAESKTYGKSIPQLLFLHPQTAKMWKKKKEKENITYFIQKQQAALCLCGIHCALAPA